MVGLIFLFFSSEEAVICNADSYFIQCQNILHKIRLLNPQQEIDGLHNIWIIKPGAKSRGRGRIMFWFFLTNTDSLLYSKCVEIFV